MSLMSGKQRPLLVAPTGSGKTVMFSHLAMAAFKKCKRVFIMAHRDELLDQISETLDNFHVPHGFIASGRIQDPTQNVYVCSTMTLARRLLGLTPPDLIIIDEAHHTTKAGVAGKILACFPNAKTLGVTASPKRLSGEALGDIFDDLIIGPTVRDLIGLGALCPFVIFAPPGISTAGLPTRMGDFAKDALEERVNQASITGDAIREYSKHASGKRAVVFCVSIKHAQDVAAKFKAAGFRSASLDGTMERGRRKALVAEFRVGTIQILTVCEIISEGFDLPAIECAIMLRPTKSLALWIQQSGRALRPFEGKSHAIILDHAGNFREHGLPDEIHPWSLEGSKKSKKKSPPSLKTCLLCYAVSASGARQCEQCGHIFPIKERELDINEDEELEMVDQDRIRRERAMEQGKAQTLEDLISVGRSRGMKNPGGWARHVMAARQLKRGGY